MTTDKRNHYIQIRLNDEEKELLEKKFRISKCKSKSRFVRLMILEGFVLHFEEEKIRELLRLFGNISSNVNQIAVRVNTSGNIYADDIKEIEDGIEKIWQQLRYFQSLLRKLKP